MSSKFLKTGMLNFMFKNNNIMIYNFSYVISEEEKFK